MKNISKYITYLEATTSQTATRKGINNTPTDAELINMQLVAVRVFDVVRDHFKTPLRVSSFYRCLKLNTAVGGAKNSQHKTGQAIDIQGTGNVSNKAIFEFIKNNLEFDQLIAEFPIEGKAMWIHVSLCVNKNRQEAIIATKKFGKTVYLSYDGNEKLLK